MPILEIVTLCPAAKPILAEYGLHCFSCAGSQYETLVEGCKGHGFEDDEIDELVDDLNTALKEMPARPQTLTVTGAAARAVKDVAVQEGRTGEGLAVIVDASGGFCMEFQQEPEEGSTTFGAPEEPSVRIFASALTLQRIGGATIDFREGRFKLDLPEDDSPGSCPCAGGMCHCADKPGRKGK